jgi:hypothetical protein
VVRCTGFFRTTPLLEFLHKGAHISNVTGEKISESQVVLAVRRSVEQFQIELKHFTVSPVWGDPPRYQILAEAQDVQSPDAGELLARRVDEALRDINCEYHEKRATGRLDVMQWLPLPEGTWARFTRQRQMKLGSLNSTTPLVPDLQFSNSSANPTLAAAA